MNRIDSPFVPLFPTLSSPLGTTAKSPFTNMFPAFLMSQAFTAFLDGQSLRPAAAGVSTPGLTPQDAPPPPADPERDAAQARIKDIMGDYHIEDGDSDEKAQQIADDPTLCKYLTPDQRITLVKGLFDGSTGEDEEDAAMTIIRSSPQQDLQTVVNGVGWDDIEDELDDEDIDEIHGLLARPPEDQSHQMLDKVGVTDADLDPKDGIEWSQFEDKVRDAFNNMTPDALKQLADEFLNNKTKLLKEISDLQRSGQTSKANYLKREIELLGDKTTDPNTKSKLKQMAFEVQYTRDISENLRQGDYGQLLTYLPKLADPNASVEERTAVFESLKRERDEVRAMEVIVQHSGTPDQQSQLRRFMNTYDDFMDSWNPNVPPQDLLHQLLDKLGKTSGDIKAEFDELKGAIDALVKEIGNDLTVSHLLGTGSDDDAVALVGELRSKNLLDDAPTEVKVDLIRKMLDGFTGDGEEQAIIDILRATKERNPAEFHQIMNDITWDELDSNIQGDQWDEFLKLVNS
jgi:hypothetical protein